MDFLVLSQKDVEKWLLKQMLRRTNPTVLVTHSSPLETTISASTGVSLQGIKALLLYLTSIKAYWDKKPSIVVEM